MNKLKHKSSNSAGAVIMRIAVYLFLTGLAFVFLYPFMIMLVDSVKTYADISNNTVKWIPRNFTLSNYKLAFEALNVWRTGANSVIVTVLATAGHMISCSLVAYGFARYRFPLRNALFAIVVLSILIPTQTIIIPSYITYTNMHIVDTHLPMILPTFFGFGLRGGIFIFLFRQYFIKVPKSLEEAAAIDGCGPLRTFAQVVLPSTGATMVVCFLLSMVWHFNDSYEPSIYLTNYDQYMLPQMLSMLSANLSNMQGDIANAAQNMSNDVQIMYHRGVVMAAVTICLIPLFVLYVVMQRKFVEGVERSGLTGE